MRILFVSAFGAWKRPASYIKSQSDSLKETGIEVTDFYLKHRGPLGYLKSYYELLRFLKQYPEFDIIHAHFGYTAFLAYLTLSKAKLVISFMGDDLYGILNDNSKQTIKGRFNIILSKFLQTKAKWIIVKSKRMMNFITPELKKITTVIPNGVNFNKFPILNQTLAKEKLSLDSSKKCILFLGSKTEKRKNFKLLEEASKYIKAENVFILNPYPVKGEEVHLYLNAADVLVLTSTLEGSPNVIKEAIVCNCPIVSTDVGDVIDRIKDIEGCYLADFNKIDLAEKIDKALNFASRTNGRTLSDYLKIENIAQSIKEVYLKIYNN